MTEKEMQAKYGFFIIEKRIYEDDVEEIGLFFIQQVIKEIAMNNLLKYLDRPIVMRNAIKSYKKFIKGHTEN